MKKAVLILLVYLLSCPAFAFPLLLKRGEIESGYMEVMVTLDGFTTPIKLDTGANSTQLLAAPWNAHYPVLRQAQRGGASGLRYTCDVISFAKVSVEGLSQQAYEADRCALDAGHQLFGIDFFKGEALYFDFEQSALELNGPRAKGSYPLKIYEEGHISLELKILGRPYFAVFDTGAGLTSVDQPFVDRNPDSFTFVRAIQGKDGGGHSVAMKLYRIKRLEIDSAVLENEYVLAFDFGRIRDYFGENTPLILGFNVITKHNWAIDLKNNSWDLVEKR
jgi:hypothetical protein